LDIFPILSWIPSVPVPFQISLLTDAGMSATIYDRAYGAMQSRQRQVVKQDEMLRIIA